MNKTIVLISLSIVFGCSLMAQQIRTYTTNPQDSTTCITALSLYIEFFKQGNLTDAVSGWRTAVQICPKSSESLYINGVKIYAYLIDNEKDAVRKEKLIDTLMWVYDQRIVHYGNEGYILGRKGVDLYKYRQKEPRAVYDILNKAYELQKTELEPASVQIYFKSALDLLKKNAITKAELFELYANCSEVVEANLNGKLRETYLKIQDSMDTWIGGVANCDEIIEIFSPKFKSSPNDAKLINQIIKLMDKQNCGDRDFYIDVAVAGYNLSPTPRAAYDIGKGYYSKSKLGDALRYFKEAFAETENKDLLFSAYKYAALCALQTNQFQLTKSYALKMLELNSNSGEAYILIGNAYARGKSHCGTDECRSRAAYWAAVDKFQRAKAVDPSVADQAQQLINSYTAQFPEKGDCFFYSLTDGASFTLECWIGETTTVRTRQ